MKKQRELWMTPIIATSLLLLSVGLPQSTAADTAINLPEDVIEAVKASPTVQAEIARERKRINAKELTQNEIKIMGLGGACGVAGCSANYLAVITVHRRGVNPQTSSVLAMVRRSPKGILGRVSIVELKYKGLQESKLEIQKRYSSPLSIIERK